ncbi:MAG: hypothetical protein C5B55_03530 [Blastocatellia bacterium]|nr:MAG: hypothetical protein C5B55_03530 [Blastocatellia bacterium]
MESRTRSFCMLKRSIVLIAIVSLLFISAAPLRTVHGIAMSGAEKAFFDSTDTSDQGANQKDGGNSFVSALKAPFRAIGRLFGGGKKQDNKPHRIADKDMKKFETAPVTRVTDATLVNSTPQNVTRPTAVPDPEGTADPAVGQALENLERGRQLLNQNKINEAIASLTAATSQNPKLKDAYNLLGVAYEIKGLRELALKSLETAVRGGSDNPEHLSNYGYLLFKNGDYDSAAKYLKKAVKLAPNNQRYWNNLGLVQAQREKFDDAYVCFEKAVGPYEGHLNVANRLQALGHDNEAIKHLELARAITPNSKEILVRLIALYRRTGKEEKADEVRKAFVGVSSVATAPNR